MSSLLRASDFCRPNKPQKHAVQFRITHKRPLPSSAAAWVSVSFLKRVSLMARSLAFVEYNNRQIVVRLELLEDHESEDTETVYLSPMTAANLCYFAERTRNNEKGRSGYLVVSRIKPETATKVKLFPWGRPLPISSFVPSSSPETSQWSFPRSGNLLQPGTLTFVCKDKQVFVYEIVEINEQSDTSTVYQTSSNTHYRLEMPPTSTICPRLPPLWDELLPPHPNVLDLIQALDTPTQSIQERIWHIIGTNEEHHVETAVQTAAREMGRQCVMVSGLAAFAYTAGRSVSTGSLVDKLSGLEAALEQAHCHAPSVLYIHGLDQELRDTEARHDEESRMWTILLEGLNSQDNYDYYHHSPLQQVPTVLVVLSTAQALTPGPLLESLVFPSIALSRPDQAYTEYLWKDVKNVPFHDVYLLLKGRPASEITRIKQALLQSEHSDPLVALEKLCQDIDDKRRHKSGMARIPSVQWEDVGGLDHVRQEIMDAIELPLKYPHLFVGSGRSGILLYGPPGTGKTLVAKAVATECRLPFLSIKGPELLGSYVGESEAQVRGVFDQARQLALQNQPAACVLFFDELDSLAPRRGDQASGGNVMDRVVATLFAELDKHSQGGTVFCMGATNRPDLLDPALLRPGRLDRLVYLGVSGGDRERILAAQIRKLRLEGEAEEIAVKVVEHLPLNLTGADLSTIATGGLLRATERLCAEADEELLQLQRDGKEGLTLDHVLDTWDEDRLEPLVTVEDLLEASKNVIPSVTATDLEKYASLQEQFQTK